MKRTFHVAVCKMWVFLLVFTLLCTVDSAGEGTSQDGIRFVEEKTIAGNITDYHTYEDLSAEMHALAARHSDIAMVTTIGRTYEGRDILAMKISDNPRVEEMDEPDVLITGAHHAREWISFEVPIYIMNILINNYTSETHIRWLVENREIWIVPMLNPDGVAYTQDTGDSWRKNRQPWRGELPAGGTAQPIGVDLNRNYGYMWGTPNAATSQNPYSDTYRGPEPFSERETTAIKLLAEQHRFVLSLSYHSYGGMVLYPWGYTTQPTEEDGIFRDIGGVIANLTGYELMQASELYLASGDSDDFLYAEHGIFAYTIELADEFAPPPEEIYSVCRQNIEAALFVIEIADNPLRDSPVIIHEQERDMIKAEKPYRVEAKVTSATGLGEDSVELFYKVDDEEYNYVTMTLDEGNTYVAYIPGQEGGSTVDYYISASDIKGHTSTNKRYAPFEVYSYFVDIEIATSTLDYVVMGFMIVCMYGTVWGGFYRCVNLAMKAEARKRGME